jgi:hypothetical protein
MPAVVVEEGSASKSHNDHNDNNNRTAFTVLLTAEDLVLVGSDNGESYTTIMKRAREEGVVGLF